MARGRKGEAIDPAKVEEWRKALATKAKEAKKAPPKVMNKRAAVEAMKPEIEALLAKGYTLADVVESLQGLGFTIAPATLKEYWQALKKDGETAKKPVKRVVNKTTQEPAKPAVVAPENRMAPQPNIRDL